MGIGIKLAIASSGCMVVTMLAILFGQYRAAMALSVTGMLIAGTAVYLLWHDDDPRLP